MKITIKDLYPIIADGKIPDYPVMVYANGQPASISWKWEFVRPAEEDDEQPAEGTNHIRIEVKTEWQPFDTDNIPEAKEGWCLLINRGSFAQCYNPTNEFWLDDECNSLTESKDFFKGMPYKLVPLP